MGNIITTIAELNIEELAPMPASVGKIANLINDPDTNIQEIADTIKFDEALTANVIKHANSAFHGASSKISSVKDAVLRLGTGNLLKLAVGQQTASQMKESCPGYDFGEHEMWRHSVAAALAAEHIGDYVSIKVPGVAFTASLIHDIGKLLLGRHLSEEVRKSIRYFIEEKGITWYEAEQKVLGTNHAEVGGAIARHWKFPEELVSAIELHHTPDHSPNTVLDVVHLTNAVSKLIGEGIGAEQMNLFISVEAAERLGLTSSGLEALCSVVRAGLARAEKQYRG